MKQNVNIIMYADTYDKIMKAVDRLSDGGKVLALLNDARRIFKDDILPKRAIVLKWDKNSLSNDWNDDGGPTLLSYLNFFASTGDDGFAYAKIDYNNNSDTVNSSGGVFENLFAVEKRIVGIGTDE